MIAGDKVAIILPVKIRIYIDENGNEPFSRWLRKQDKTTQHFVKTKLLRVKQRQVTKVKSYGPIAGIILNHPTKIRIYYGIDDHSTIILLGGYGDRQSKDIERAKKNWNDYLSFKDGND